MMMVLMLLTKGKIKRHSLLSWAKLSILIQKLGILENFGGDYYKLSFSIYQLFFTDINRKNQDSGLKYITPYFLTKRGIVILENNNEYISELNVTILIEEFSKREIKNYSKKKTKNFK